MNHTYFLVSIESNCKGQTLWEYEANRFWQKFEKDHSLLIDPERLVLTDEELDTLLKCDRLGFMVKEFDSTVTNSLWAEFADDEGGPAQLTERLCLDKSLGGEWQLVETRVK